MALSRDSLWESGHDETVEVNQRALIDKVLARYSGEFTVFRELLQNSDDAQSSVVEIHFETKSYLDRTSATSADTTSHIAPHSSSLPDLKTTPVHQWTFKNNGMAFREEDWSRLKKIAEGNPDEEKIGAFGVGFYSLFSVTEEPFVQSGDQWMGFYWKDKKDQLFARRGRLPAAEDPSALLWTTFTMTLRDATAMPLPFDFARFLASSITFMKHLSEVSVYFDDKRLIRLKKAPGVPESLGIPKGLKSRSPGGRMMVINIESTPLYIQAEVMKWVYSSGSTKKSAVPLKTAKSGQSAGFFSSLFSSFASGPSTPQPPTPAPLPPVDPLETNTTGVSLSVFSATVVVQLDKKTAVEIHRSTKKNPPSKMRVDLIYTAKDQYDLSVEEDTKFAEGTGSVFQGLRADLLQSGLAKVFIGHSTAQSTGIGGHLSARFIPTVERESIDFMDRYVAIWNRELLYVGAFLARSAYEFEMVKVREEWNANSTATTRPTQEIQTKLFNRVNHCLKFFGFYPSTPSHIVSEEMRSAFFGCSSDGRFPLISTAGVRDAKEIRLPNPAFALFVKDLPVLPDLIDRQAGSLTNWLLQNGMIWDIKFDDVIQELQSRPLPLEQCIACLTWWTNAFMQDSTSRADLIRVRNCFVDALVLDLKTDKNEQRIIPLNTVKSFLNPRSPTTALLPQDCPLPDHLLPALVSKHFSKDSLTTSLGWTEFTLQEWISYICGTPTIPPSFDIKLSPPWSETVLGILARSWPQIPTPDKEGILRCLRDIPCVPTNYGMKLPRDAYFPNVNIFGDLPIVTFAFGQTIKGNMDKLLQSLGVRRHVELQIIFNRMVKTNEWTIADLIKYLVSVRGSLSADEFQKLKETAAFPKEISEQEGGAKKPRYKAKELYAPVDSLRSLGLPIIDWGSQNKWRHSSDEAKFLYELGLQRQPPLQTLIKLCADGDANVRTIALQYLVDNVETKYTNYDPMDYKDVKFIPALSGSTPVQTTILEVYSDPQWAILGLFVLQPKWLPVASKLQVREKPTTTTLVSILQLKPPTNHAQATGWFSLMASRVNDFKTVELERLSNIEFVPIGEGASPSRLPPSKCYLHSGSRDAFHAQLFTFVDFGASGNAFLAACGAKSQPGIDEVAKMLVDDPRRFYDIAGDPLVFLDLLRNLAVNANMIPSMTLLRAKNTPILLGLKRQPRGQKKADDEWEQEWDVVYHLKKPSEVFIADDTATYQSFGDVLFCAPQEDILEGFYTSLGAKKLSQVVKVEHQTSAEQYDAKIAQETRSLILERLPLFLHEQTHTRTRVSFNWLSDPKNFVVRIFGKILVVKHLNFGDIRSSTKQDTSAVGNKSYNGPVELWLAANVQLDMYEVATALNKILFDSPKTNDALLLMTILSTDLRALKRRGYNIDRILRHQREQKEARIAAQDEKRKQEMQAAKAADTPAILPPPPPSLASKPTAQSSENPRSSSLLSSFQSMKRKLGGKDQLPPLPPPHDTDSTQPDKYSLNKDHIASTQTSQRPSSTPQPPSPVMESMPGGFSQGGAGHTPTPSTQSNIERNVQLAVDACSPETANQLQNREKMTWVKESKEDGYCDASGRKEDLHNIAEMGSIKIYLSAEIPLDTAPTFMETKSQPIARFIHVMTALARVYKIQLRSLHIFYDLEGGLIAFNRNGSIFLNLRYYEQWHDETVGRGQLHAAYVSWYFTIAHEMAHNLVSVHNSEHEFYFSAICEHFMMDFTRLLTEAT